jgi:hypothetical protein
MVALIICCFLNPFRQMTAYNLRLGYDHVLQYPFKFIIHYIIDAMNYELLTASLNKCLGLRSDHLLRDCLNSFVSFSMRTPLGLTAETE